MRIFQGLRHAAGVAGLYCILSYALGGEPSASGAALAIAITAMIRTYEKAPTHD